MVKIIAYIIIVIALATTGSIWADEEAQPANIKVSVSVFSLDSEMSNNKIAEILQQPNLKNVSNFIAKAGESTELDIDRNDGEKGDSFTINFKANDSATKYDIEFPLVNGGKITIPGISSYEVGNDLVFTARIGDSSKLIKVATNVIGENSGQQLAMQMLTLSKRLVLVDSDQEYFQEDKIWVSDHRRYRIMNRFEEMMGVQTFYLTNNDPERLIKGIIELSSPKLLRVPRSEYNFGIHNFGLKNNQLEFVVLPGKTVLIGRWQKTVALEIKEASFLSDEDVEKLKAASENE